MTKSFDMFKDLKNSLSEQKQEFKNIKHQVQIEYFIRVFKQLIIDLAEEPSLSITDSEYFFNDENDIIISDIITIFSNIDNSNLNLQNAINDFIEVINEISDQLNEEQSLNLGIIKEALESHQQDNEIFEMEEDISLKNQSSSRTPYLTEKEIKLSSDQNSSETLDEKTKSSDSSETLHSYHSHIDISLAMQRVRLDSEHLSFETKMSGSIEPSYRSSLTIAKHYHHIDDFYSASFIDSIGIYDLS